MKKICLIVFLVSQVLPVLSQDFMTAKYFNYYDKAVIDSILGANGIEKSIIFQTLIDDYKLIRGEDDSKIASFMLWPEDESTCLKLITKDSIFCTIKVKSNNLFSDLLSSLWADKSEDNLNFVPPILSPFNSDIVIYIHGSEKYFFESGELHYYTENLDKVRIREGFIEAIEELVNSRLKCFKAERINKRYLDKVS